MSKTINAGDAVAWKHCRRRVWYDHNPPKGTELVDDPFNRLVKEAGHAHEQRVRRSIGEVIEATSAENTLALMKARVPVIYQDQLYDPELDIAGRPDFLLLSDEG